MAGSGNVMKRTGKATESSDAAGVQVEVNGERREQFAARTREWQGKSVALLELGARTASMWDGASEGFTPSSIMLTSVGRIPWGISEIGFIAAILSSHLNKILATG